jgi:hypothetical protein
MRSVNRVIAIVALVPLLPGSVGAAPPDAFDALAGHWRCTVAGARPAARSYVALASTANGPHAGEREAFGREDTTESNGAPSSSFERIAVNPDGHSATIESVEGTGTSAEPALLRFTGRSNDGDAALALTYAVVGDTLRRTATRGAVAVDDERCTRDAQTPPSAACETPNTPARTLHAEEPEYPPEAAPLKAKGLLTVRVVVDDRSQVLWADIYSSTNHVFDAAATRAARDSTFQTRIVRCRPIAAMYLFGVDFSY